jgi:hypothetical protein
VLLMDREETEREEARRLERAAIVRDLAAMLAMDEPVRKREASPVRLALGAGDIVHGPLPAVVRRAWWRDPLVLWRPWAGPRQLRPSVWVADDLSTYVASAAEAMTMHDPIEFPGSDGAMRRWRRCSYDVWQSLRSEHAGSPAIERLRSILADLHGLGILERLNGNARAAA